MVTMIIDAHECTVPGWVTSLRSFLKWRHTDEFPKRGRFWWLQGNVWTDTEMEDIFSHVMIKTEFTRAIANLVLELDSGFFLTNGVLLSNPAADISGEPDGLFVSNASIAAESVRFNAGSRDGFTMIVGSPDMVLEIVSRGSVRKDKVVLREAYWTAGVQEYWLVDARKGEPQFDILRRGVRGFQATRKVDGWPKSKVFGKSFRLTKQTGIQGLPKVVLEIG